MEPQIETRGKVMKTMKIDQQSMIKKSPNNNVEERVDRKVDKLEKQVK